MRDALILAPVSIAVLGLIWALDSVMMGASSDLVDHYLPLYFAAWFVAWLLGSWLLRLPFIPRDLSHLTRCLVLIAMFWPIHGLASALAEEWTILHRKATWTEPSDMGYTYMYGEMSGMGYARGWMDWDRKIRSHSLGGLFAGVVWVPVLLISCFTWKKILGDAPAHEQFDTKPTKDEQDSGGNGGQRR